MLVLGGGGAKGLAHIGVVKVLERLGISISEYAGTSAGAIVAAMAASGMKADEIERVGLAIRQSDIFDFNYTGLLKGPSRINGLCKGENLRKLIKRVIPVNRFDELQKPLFLSSFNIGSGETIFWGTDAYRDVSLHDAIYASCAIPGIFPPQKIGDAYYIDGGVADNLPLQMAKIRNHDLIIAVKLSCRRLTKGDDIMKGGILSLMEQFYDIKNRELSEYRRQDQVETPLILIEPEVEDHWLFKVHRTQELIRRGEDKAFTMLKSYPEFNKEQRKRVQIDEVVPYPAPSFSLTV